MPPMPLTPLPPPSCPLLLRLFAVPNLNQSDDRTPSASERLEAFHTAAAQHYAGTERVHIVRLKLEYHFRHGLNVALHDFGLTGADGRAWPQARQAH